MALNASVRWAGEWQGRLPLIRRWVASSETEISYLLEGGSLPSSEAEMIFPLEGGSLPSSEAEMICPLEGRFTTLERGGDAGRSRGSRWEPSSEAEIVPRAREGREWAVC